MLPRLLPVILIFTLVFGNLLPAPSASASVAPSTDWDAIGQTGGPTQGIAVQGDYAYLGIGPRLVVVDISDPANPHQVGATALLGDFVLDVMVSGTLAYVAAGGAGLQVVDIANPLAPALIGAWNSPGFAEGVTVSGSMVYLADGPYGLRVVDVTNPATPFEIAHAFDMNYAYAVAISGRYAYIAAGGAGLLIADISNPAYPVALGSYDTPGNARGLVVLNNLAYVADERYGLQIINVTDPLHPVFSSALQTYGWAFDVAISGSTAYLAAAFGGLRILNVLDPAHPLEVGSLTWAQSNAAGLALAGDRLYLADRKNGLRVINSADPAHPLQAGLFNSFREALMVVTGGNYAYVAAGYNGVHILDISDPSQPVEVGHYPIDAIITQLKLNGDRLYAGCFGPSGAWGDYVLDISNPTQPQFISFGQWCGECHGIDAAGNIGFFADTNGVRIVDFTDPLHPQQLYDTQENTAGVLISGNLAYIPRGSELKIYDISDPANPTVLGNFQDPLGFLQANVVLSGAIAYLNDWWGVRILDVTDPSNPTEVAFYPTPQETAWLALSGDRLYVAEGSYGVEIVDVSDPATPVRVGRFDTLGSARTLAIAGGNLLVADAEGGLQIYPLASLELLQAGAAASEPPARHEALAEPLPAQLPRQFSTAATHPSLPSHITPDRPASTCTVTSAADSGPGTLRECLLNQVSGDVITFDPAVFPPASPVTIQVGAERLPWLDTNITLDASNAGVILDGTNVGGEWDPGIGIGSDNNIVRGLQIYNFPGAGIDVHGNNNLIGGSRLIGNGPTGQGNVLSSNRLGIALSDQDNQLMGNIIGLDATGTQAMGNEIGIGLAGQNNIIGSLEAGKNNIISASIFEGIGACAHIDDGNQIIGNYVGTDISGTLDRGNGGVGIYVECGTSNTLVQGNLVSGNQLAGIIFGDHSSDFNVVIGNQVGTTLDGNQPLLNGGVGIYVGGAAYSRIGGAAPGEGNRVGTGTVEVGGMCSGDTLVQGNWIGLNAAGTSILPNAGSIVLYGSTRAIVGGATPAESNFVTTLGNFSLDARSANNVIAGNFFGLAVDGVTPLTTAGFQIYTQRNGNIIQGNQIANATSAGIWVDGAQTNTIRRNSIWANPFKGIFLDNGANNNLPAPAISLDASGGSGTTCPNCIVELFLDEGNQGRFYLDSLIADSSGNFTFPPYCPLPYTNLTATATDLQGNTSQFSDPQAVPWDCDALNPLPTLSALDPASVKEFDPTTLLTITGTNFIPGSVVQINGEGLTTLYADDSHIQAILPVGQITTTGTVSITVFNPIPGGGTSNALPLEILPHEVTDPTDLALSMTGGPDLVMPGDVLTYTLQISNLGPSLATGVILTDTLPDGVTLDWAIPSQGGCTGTTVITCELGEVYPYLGASVQIRVTVDVSASGILLNQAWVSALEPDPDPHNNHNQAQSTVHVNSALFLPLVVRGR
ncbi:MAG TPA: NosD domain-containing protein [Anaerolineaceae bacterium]|nr:NosD domain-containing protein [Anaerolineaceae bacterium]